MAEPVLFANDDKEAWLEARKDVVTGSNVAAVMGLHPYRTPQDAFDYYIDPKPLKESRFLWWGRFNEEPNLRALEAILTPTLVDVQSTHAFYKKGPMGATLDATAVCTGRLPKHIPEVCSAPSYLYKHLLLPLGGLDEGEEILVELKQTQEHYKKQWAHPPKHYWAQCQVQMYCAEYKHCILFGKIGGSDCRGHVIERDDEWLEEAVEVCEQFMADVEDIRGARNKPRAVRPVRKRKAG